METARPTYQSEWTRSVYEILVAESMNSQKYGDHRVVISVRNDIDGVWYRFEFLGDDPDLRFEGQAVLLGDISGLKGEIPFWLKPQHVLRSFWCGTKSHV